MMKLGIALAVMSWAFYSEMRTTPVEIEVATLISGRITDVDEGAAQGVAVVDATPGWEYSINDRATWQPASNLSLLLNTSAWLRHPMDSQARLTYRAWDQTEGIIGAGFTITATGGETAFSDAAHTVAFVLGTPVDEDMRLPITWRALSVGGNVAAITNVTYAINPPEMGAWQPRQNNDPLGVIGYFVPAGPVGSCTLTVSGLNKKNQQVSGNLAIDVVPGAAQVVEVTALQQVER